MEDNIVKLPCSSKIAHQIHGVLERLQDQGFSAVFNGHNFDIIDNHGKCLNDKYGIDYDLLEEYSMLDHYFAIGEKVKITYERTKEDRLEANEYDEDEGRKDKNGMIGIVTRVCNGDSVYVGRTLLFDINTEDGYIDLFVPGDFEAV